MAVAQVASGSQAATLDTEHTLHSLTALKTSELVIDLNPMVAGDIMAIRYYEKTLTGSTERLVWEQVVGHAQAEPVFKSIPCTCVHAGSFRIEQTDGTGRTFDWSVRTLD
jgi:hypothetical protein